MEYRRLNLGNLKARDGGLANISNFVIPAGDDHHNDGGCNRQAGEAGQELYRMQGIQGEVPGGE
jgi:hypothetical protein